MKIRLLVLCACVALFVSALNAVEYSVAKDSHIGFKVKKFAVVNVEGYFKEFEGILVLDEGGKISALQGKVVVKSVFSGDEKRDKHLLEADFLDAQQFPTMSLIMQSYTLENVINGAQKGKLVATLILHGKKKSVEFESTLDTSSNMPKLNLQGAINIKDFDIQGSMMNANKVNIIINTKWEAK